MLRTRPRAAALALACSAFLVAAGCGGDDAAAPAPAPGATASGTPTASATPTPSGTGSPAPVIVTTGPNPGISSDFPVEEVPLVPGQVVLPLGLGDGTGPNSGWVLQLELAQQAGACFTAAARELIGAGFIKQAETKDANVQEAQFAKPGYAVIISATKAENGGCRLGYEVGEVAGGLAQ